jgi:simple sugar transport system substrate-binding protein
VINVNSFTLGARSVDPSIITSVIFTGEWSMPVKEAKAANSMADQGSDVLTCHVR